MTCLVINLSTSTDKVMFSLIKHNLSSNYYIFTEISNHIPLMTLYFKIMSHTEAVHLSQTFPK